MTQNRVTDAPEASESDTQVADAPAQNSDPLAQTEAPAPPDASTLQRERDEYRDRFMRKAAEFDNYRKRTERERREQADRAVVDLLRDVLLAVDDLDIALMVDPGEGGASYRRGVELIHAKLHELLRKYGVRPIEALGADFDPNVHQAVIHEFSPEHREGEVIGELRKGYKMGDRLLRPAMVKVAKA